MASLWRALHVWRGLHQHASSCPAGASLRFAHCAPFPSSWAHLPSTRGWVGQPCAAASDSSDIELWEDEYKEQVGEDGAVVLPMQSDGAPLWFGKLPSIDDVRTVKDWPQHVRDWRQFWAAVKVWRRCLSCRNVFDLHQLPSTAELAWLRLLDSKGRLREVDICLPLSAARGRQALEAVEARREELVALGARPPAMSQSALPPSVLPAEFELDDAAQVAANDPGLRPQYEELLARAYPEEEQRARVLAEEAERLAEDEVWRAAEEAARVAWEARWAARVAARDRVKAKRARAGLESEKGAEPEEASGLEQGLGPEEGFVPERESGPEEGAEPVEVPEPLPPRRVTLAERLWRPHVKRWLTKLAVDEWVRQKKRDMQGYDAMNVVRDGMVAEAARVLELSDDESTEGKAAKRVGGLLPQPEEADYALAGPLEEEEPYTEPWDAWDECDWRAYMEKRAARERRHALFRQVQAETRLERGVNVCATTDTRLIGKLEWGERPSRVHTHAEIMDCITLGGRAVPPDRVGLHVYPIGEGSDYFLEGVRYAPESVEILQSMGRLRVADAELLGLNPDTAASATLSESFADLDGTSPAVLPPADARPRDALDDGGADAVAADRWVQPVAPTASYEEEVDDDDALGLVLP